MMSLSSPPSWLTHAAGELGEMARLEDGWDGADSPAPTKQAIAGAFRLLSEVERYPLPAPHIGPALGGGLGIEWRVGARDLDFEVLPDGAVEYLKATNTGNGFDVERMEEGSIPRDRWSEARSLVDWLLEGTEC